VRIFLAKQLDDPVQLLFAHNNVVSTVEV